MSDRVTDAGVPPIVDQLVRLRDLLVSRAAQLAQHLAMMQAQDAQSVDLQRTYEDAQRRAAEAVAFAEGKR